MGRDSDTQGTPVNYAQALGRARRLCAASERCASDIGRHLEHWGLSEADVRQIVDTLYQEDFLNDARFALAFASDRIRFQKWGELKVRHALRVRGIPSPIVSSALQQLAQEGVQVDLPGILARRIQALHPQADDAKLRGSLMRFAANRGFPPEQIFDAVRRVVHDYFD